MERFHGGLTATSISLSLAVLGAFSRSCICFSIRHAYIFSQARPPILPDTQRTRGFAFAVSFVGTVSCLFFLTLVVALGVLYALDFSTLLFDVVRVWLLTP